MVFFRGELEKTVTTPVKTKIRRSHLGIRYDIYVGERYCGTAYKASEIEPLITSLKLESN